MSEVKLTAAGLTDGLPAPGTRMMFKDARTTLRYWALVLEVRPGYGSYDVRVSDEYGNISPWVRVGRFDFVSDKPEANS